MRHARRYRKLNLPTDQRLQVLTDLVVALFTHDKIKTTVTRAKEAQALADRFVTLAKRPTLAAKRRLAAYVKRRPLVKMIVDKAQAKFEGRTSGYTRVVRVGFRRGDGAPLAMLELV